MTQVGEVLRLLNQSQVKYIIIGGVAATVHGSAYLTNDLDVCYERSEDNIIKLSEAFSSFHPYPRGAPEGLPFVFDAPTIKSGLNFTLTTDLGDIDFLGEVGGIGTYDEAKAQSVDVELFHHKCLILNLDSLIKSKKFAGRKKDELVVIELEAIREMLFSKNSNL